MGVIAGIVMGLLRVIGGLMLLVLRFAWPLLLCAGLVFLRRRRRGKAGRTGEKAAREPEFSGPVYTVDYREVEEEPALSAEPDGPAPFGYKTCWLAVRCNEAESVMEALGLRERTPANWATGLAAAYDGRGVFVSPCLDGFVLAVGIDSARLPEEFADKFPEVQFFGDHRVADYFQWRRWLNGRDLRDYCWDGGEAQTDHGALTPEELALGFDRFPHPGGDWAEDQRFPDEEDVLAIAAAWGVDPRFEQKTYPPSAGWLCTW